MNEPEAVTEPLLHAAVPGRSGGSGWQTFVRLLRDFFLISHPPSLDLPFTADEVARFHQLAREDAGNSLDEQTWKDLELGRYLDSLSGELSIFGQQSLHHRLCGGANGQEAANTRDRIRYLLQDRTLLASMGEACLPLRETATEASTALFGHQQRDAPGWLSLVHWLPLLVVAALLLSVVTPYAWIAAAVGCVALVAVQLQMHREIEGWKYIPASLQKLLIASDRLGHIAQAGQSPLWQVLAGQRVRASTIHKHITPSPLLNAPLVSAYANWLFLANVRHYFKAKAQIELHRDFLQQCFIEVGKLEADIALARHLLRHPRFCWADRQETNSLVLKGVVNPLLKQAAPMTVEIRGKGIFLSGQNGVGKSTLLRAIGLNLVAARAFGFCYARQAAAPALNIHTSIQMEDSLTTGESLYMAELRRARELLAYSQGIDPCLIIIDEIFRGTNHLEGTSAAAAVLETMAKRTLLIVSSHNLVLASLLADHLQPYCIERVSRQESNADQLRLAAGVLAETNGIAMLSSSDFSADIQDAAAKVYSWLSVCLADPAKIPRLRDL